MKRILALSLAWAAIGLMTAQAQPAAGVYPYLTDPVFNKTEPFDGVAKEGVANSGGNIWAKLTSADYPNVLIFGEGAFKLYHNNGNGAYTDTTALIKGVPAIVGLGKGAAAWLDYNNDNVADLVIAGTIKQTGDVTTQGTMLFKGEKTGGVYTLTYDATLSAQLPQGDISLGTDWEHNGTRWIAVADYNADGNDDILMSYKLSGSYITSLYKSNGAAFELQNSLVNGTNFEQVGGGSIVWGQMGGKPAFILNGRTNGGGEWDTYAGVYKQDAAGNFSLIRLTQADGSLIGLKSGEAAWIDYDKDGKQDIVLTGAGVRGSSNSNWDVVFLLHNEGDTTFSEVSAHGLQGACATSVAVGDLNNDGWLDLAIIGEQRSNVFYNTQGLGSDVFEQHNRAFELPKVKRGCVNILDVNNDGKMDLAATGGGDGTELTPVVYTNALPKQLPREFVAPSPIEEAVVPFTIDTVTLGKMATLKAGGTAWGDYNNDGHLDLLMWGYSNATSATFTSLYKNNGNGTFTDVTADILGGDFPKIWKGAAAWIDYNADGRLDLVLTGTTARGDGEDAAAVTKIYKNDGHTNHWRLIEDQYVTGLSANPVHFEAEGANARIISVADYNLDGYPDILMEGRPVNYATDDEGNIVRGRAIFLFTNVPHANPDYDRDFQRKEIRNISSGMATWGDYNNDGYPDILFTGYMDKPAPGTPNCVAGIYKNNGGTGDFTLLEGTNFLGTERSEIAWIDYNNDGWQDVLIPGKYYPVGGGDKRTAKLYKNNGGDGTFTEVENTGLSQFSDCISLSIADVNNDGYPDIAVMGWTEDDKPKGTTVYYYNAQRRPSLSPSHPDSAGTAVVYEYIIDRSVLNDNTNFSGAISFEDYNGDGKLDLLYVGDWKSTLYKNAGSIAPTKPAKPTGLKSEVGSDGSITLSWDKASDAGVSYGVYLYKKGVRYGLAGALTGYPMAVDTSGARRVGLDNATKLFDNTVTISGLGVADGAFEWGVVAIGANRAMSEAAVVGKSSPGTAVAKAPLGSFKVFARGEALVAATDIAAENAELTVYNAVGAQLWAKKGCFLGETEINGLPQGICFVVIRVGNQIMVEKAVK